MGMVASVVLTGAITYRIGGKRFKQYVNEELRDRALIETLMTNKAFSVRVIEDTPDNEARAAELVVDVGAEEADPLDEPVAPAPVASKAPSKADKRGSHR